MLFSFNTHSTVWRTASFDNEGFFRFVADIVLFEIEYSYRYIHLVLNKLFMFLFLSEEEIGVLWAALYSDPNKIV